MDSEGGFGSTSTLGGKAVCGSAGTGSYNFGGGAVSDDITTVGDYIPHHQPFQFYASTRNIHRTIPSMSTPSASTDGVNGANHQYDISAFFTALKNGDMPAVSYLKAPGYEDGHPGYSDPLDEQIFIVNTINTIMASDEWKSTAIIIAYDDSDGWYDHQPSPIVKPVRRQRPKQFHGGRHATSPSASAATLASQPRRRRRGQPSRTASAATARVNRSW